MTRTIKLTREHTNERANDQTTGRTNRRTNKGTKERTHEHTNDRMDEGNNWRTKEGTNVEDLESKTKCNLNILHEPLGWIPHPTFWAGGPPEGITISSFARRQLEDDLIISDYTETSRTHFRQNIRIRKKRAGLICFTFISKTEVTWSPRGPQINEGDRRPVKARWRVCAAAPLDSIDIL